MRTVGSTATRETILRAAAGIWATAARTTGATPRQTIVMRVVDSTYYPGKQRAVQQCGQIAVPPVKLIAVANLSVSLILMAGSTAPCESMLDPSLLETIIHHLLHLFLFQRQHRIQFQHQHRIQSQHQRRIQSKHQRLPHWLQCQIPQVVEGAVAGI